MLGEFALLSQLAPAPLVVARIDSTVEALQPLQKGVKSFFGKEGAA